MSFFRRNELKIKKGDLVLFNVANNRNVQACYLNKPGIVMSITKKESGWTFYNVYTLYIQGVGKVENVLDWQIALMDNDD